MKKNVKYPPKIILLILSKKIHLKNAGLKNMLTLPSGVFTLSMSQSKAGTPSGKFEIYDLQDERGIKDIKR